jgi:hypothetical protein
MSFDPPFPKMTEYATMTSLIQPAMSESVLLFLLPEKGGSASKTTLSCCALDQPEPSFLDGKLPL